MFEMLAQTTQPVITGIEVFEQVSHFYQNAWGNLMWLIGILITLLVVGIGLVPWWIGYQQKRKFDIKEKELTEQILLTAKNTKKEIFKASHEIYSTMYFRQGFAAITNKNYNHGIMDYFSAIEHDLLADRVKNAGLHLQILEMTVDTTCEKEEFKEAINEFVKGGQLKDQIARVREAAESVEDSEAKNDFISVLERVLSRLTSIAQ